MLHEVLLALAGHRSQLIVPLYGNDDEDHDPRRRENPSPERQLEEKAKASTREEFTSLTSETGTATRRNRIRTIGYRVTNSVPFLSPAEVEQINQCLRLPFACKQIQAYAASNGVSCDVYDHDDGIVYGKHKILENASAIELRISNSKFPSNENIVLSPYLYAFCMGLNEIIDAYHSHLLVIEQEILRSTYFSVTSLTAHLEHYNILLPTLAAFLVSLTAENAKSVSTNKSSPAAPTSVMGVTLLNRLYIQSHSGHPLLQGLFSRLLYHLHNVLLSQILEFCQFSQLCISNDFFIETRASKPEEVPPTGSAKKPPRAVSTTAVKSPDPTDQNDHFFLNPTKVPFYLPLSIVQPILSIGNSVYVLNARRETLKSPNYSQYSRLCFTEPFLQFEQAISQLRADPKLDLNKLATIISPLYKYLTFELYSILFPASDPTSHSFLSYLDFLYNFFLCGHPTFYSIFFSIGEKMLSSPPPSRPDNELHLLYLQAKSRVKWSDQMEEYLESLRFRYSPPTDQKPSSPISTHMWRNISLDVSIPFPYSLLFSQSTQKSYSNLFSFLIRLHFLYDSFVSTSKSITYLFQRILNLDRSIKATYITFYCDRRAIIYRWSICHASIRSILHILLYHFRITILNKLYGRLLKKLQRNDNFDDISASHSQFLSELQVNFFLADHILCALFEDFFLCCAKFNEVLVTLMKNSTKLEEFLSPPPSITEQLNQSHSFSDLSSSHSKPTSDTLLTSPSISTIEYYEMEFERFLQLIFKYLSRTATVFNSTDIHSLLLHLNMNHYFSRLVNKTRPLRS